MSESWWDTPPVTTEQMIRDGIPPQCIGCQNYDCPKWGSWQEAEKCEAEE